jgi:hypothetical protein
MKTKILFLLFLLPLFASAQDFAEIPFQYGKNVKGEIKGTNVNIRSDHSVKASAITQLNTGDVFTIIDAGYEEIINGKYCQWFNIEFINPSTKTKMTGWVFGAFITYKVTFKATYKDMIVADFNILVFTDNDGNERQFETFIDKNSTIKWSNLMYSEDGVGESANPEYVGKTFILTIEYTDSEYWNYDLDKSTPVKEEVLVGVELL